MWRILSDGRFASGLEEIQNRWSIDDVADAIDLLNAEANATELASRKADRR